MGKQTDAVIDTWGRKTNVRRSWTKVWSSHGVTAPHWPLDGRVTVYPAYERIVSTTTVGGLRAAQRRVRDGDATLPADFAAYLAQRVPADPDGVLGDDVELDERGWPAEAPLGMTFTPGGDDDLTDLELLRLEDFLNAPEIAFAGAVDLPTLHGLLTAVVIGPTTIVPSRWLPVAFGTEPKHPGFFGVLALTMRLMNEIARTYARGDGRLEPVFSDDGRVERAGPWADGFLLGMEIDEPAWSRYRADPIVSEPLALIIALSDDDGAAREHASSRAAARSALPDALLQLQRFFLEQRMHPKPVLRIARPGRNDACTCGSGKKYKRCCGTA